MSISGNPGGCLKVIKKDCSLGRIGIQPDFANRYVWLSEHYRHAAEMVRVSMGHKRSSDAFNAHFAKSVNNCRSARRINEDVFVIVLKHSGVPMTNIQNGDTCRHFRDRVPRRSYGSKDPKTALRLYLHWQ